MQLRIATLLLALIATALPAQERDIVLTGGWLFTSTGAERIHNPGMVIRAGKFLRVGGDTSVAAPNADRIAIADTETVIPGLFDLHARPMSAADTAAWAPTPRQRRGATAPSEARAPSR